MFTNTLLLRKYSKPVFLLENRNSCYSLNLNQKSAFCSQAGEALCHGSATCLSTPPHSGVEYVALIPVSSVPQHHSTPPPPPPSNLHRAFNLDKQVLEMEASWVLLAKTHALLCLCYFWKTGLTQKSGVNEGGWPVYCSFSSLFFS